jgi:UDP-N-acetyl-D-glucosamine dehydrogenase
MDAVHAADCVVIVTNHSAYDYPAILNAAELIVDSRNALKLTGMEHPKVVKL